jgi:ATP-dependent helicase/nuclease subunit B
LEARLLSFDHIIVAGLDENTWPAIPAADPFLSRPMRTALGLPLPEQRIGLQAHDFIQLAAAPSVMITRSGRRGDAPTGPSRWLWRLKTLTAGADCSLPPDPALEWARTVTPTVRTFDSGLARPEPRPPIEDRPKAFSATEIETWVRDPYAIYARKVLRLEALRGLGVPLGPAERGTAIHAAVERLIQEGNSGRTEDIEVRLSILLADDLAKAGFGGIALRGQLLRLRPAIRAFATWEAKRHANLRSSHLESRGETEILLANGSLKISARADRLDVLASGFP